MRILVADDHALVRKGIRRMLLDANDLHTIGEVSTAKEVIEAVQREKWDILILDIKFADGSGLEVLRDLKQKHPKLPVLMLSMYPEEQFALRVMKAGAAGYLSKGSAAMELMNAIRKIAAGGKFMTEPVIEQLATSMENRAVAHPHELLSPGEFEVFLLLASGKTVGNIAEQLRRSVKTISTHRTRLLEKMNLKNNADIIKYAHEHKLQI